MRTFTCVLRLSCTLALLMPAGRCFALQVEQSGQGPAIPATKTEPPDAGAAHPFSYSPNIQDAGKWAPMTTRRKLWLGVRKTTNPASFAGIAFKAGMYQRLDPDSEYGRGTPGYAKRVAVSFADGASSKMLGTFVFPSLLHQDPRYFRMGAGPIDGRVRYSISRVFRTRTDAGESAFNWSRVLASLGSGALSNTYYPVEDRGAALTFANAGWLTLSEAATNLFREFWPDIKKRLAKKPCSPHP